MIILTAIDFSDPTETILRVTAKLAKRLDARVWLVHVAAPEPDFVGFDAGPEVVRDQVAKEYRDEHNALQTYAEALRADGVEVTAKLARGATIERLLELAEKHTADLIVVGSHGRGVVADLIIGSVSAGLIRGATCPVTVVPVGQKTQE